MTTTNVDRLVEEGRVVYLNPAIRATAMEWLRSALSQARQEGRKERMQFPEHKASMHITHNQHKAYYQSVEDYIAEEHLQIESDDWATPTSMERCIANDEIWELQWYPNTPVGFNKVYGASFGEVLQAALTTEGK